ncbi:MAG: protoporphyrin IX magnesium chelatase [Paludibacter sp. 47-17]|nr:MAG: protoporphyrin IX magnesium chelatase [Paludibacter sp. 47-17]
MKRKITYGISLFIVVILISVLWDIFASTTRIALINFQPYMATSIKLANTSKFVEYEELSLDHLKDLDSYDMVLGFGMGLKITEEQRVRIDQAIDKKLPMYFFAATTPENNICTLDSIQEKAVESYISNGNKRNYKNFALYIRKYIDKKSLFVAEPDSAVESASDVLYHLNENESFTSVQAYEVYLKKNGFYKEGAPKIAMVGGMNDPFSGNRANIDSIIVSFQNAGMNVYPVASFMKRLYFLSDIKPDAVLYFPHGRIAMGQADATVDWLRQQNIPLFAPLTILQKQEDWEKDPMGMFGGFMSQSVMMPELDGAIYPYVLTAQEEDKDGLYHFNAIPDRLRNFTKIVSNFIALKKKSNADKKVAIYYLKGPGQATLTAQGLETVPSLYNFLLRLKSEGYKVDNLPSDVKAFESLIMSQGAVMSTYAKGAFDGFLKTGKPALIEKAEYESWVKQTMPADLYAQVTEKYGAAPGEYLSIRQGDKSYLAVARIQFGNVVILPQPMAALGSDAFAIVHGVKSPPPHSYIGSYLWTRFGFKTDAMIHFGTHGSLEFTPEKQVALSSYDWPDRLVGTVPHFYYYSIGNIGESVMTKRRAYATTISYLTPPFMESNTRGLFKELQEKIRLFYKTPENKQPEISRQVKRIAVKMGLHRDLKLDSVASKPYTTEEIERLENFAEEISNEKITGELYISGIPYSNDKINSTVLAMSADPIAYSLANLDKIRGKVTPQQLKNQVYFGEHYLNPTKQLVSQILSGKAVDARLVSRLAGISVEELEEAKLIVAPKKRGMGSMAPAAGKMGGHPEAVTKAGGGHLSSIPKVDQRPDSTKQASDRESKPARQGHSAGIAQGGEQMAAQTSHRGISAPANPSKEYSKADKARARSIVELERTMLNVSAYKNALLQSPDMEFASIMNGLAGGYVAPGPGGDAVANPNAVPTGRNLYSINAESTPTEAAWDKGVALAEATLEHYQKTHKTYPRKISYTFWSGEFIESEGATIAQVLYMLGIEPVRDTYGRVTDLQLIDSKILGRPRVDVVVQTSGQFRDIAASRLALITKAVELAASAKDDKFENLVATSTVKTEKLLVEQGMSPKVAREMSTQRVFGGINGMYGTNIQGMITSGDKWENEKEIADTYINNMGAVYGGDKNWGQFQQGLLRAVLHNTDVIIQPRQNNTWGALSLDHVYEFMGGMNLAVRNVTGKDPEAYFADYRNRNNFRMQDLKEAIGVEARATILNPEYIKQVIKGGASSAAQIEEVATNTYGWNVTKPAVIDKELWDEMYNVYVKDKFNLGTQAFFERENPAALQEITAVMLETARKGMWKASEQQLKDIAALHTDLTKKFGATGAGFAGNNQKLQDFIAGKVDAQAAKNYQSQLSKVNSSSTNQKGVVLKKDELTNAENSATTNPSTLWMVVGVLLAFVAVLVMLRNKRKK